MEMLNIREHGSIAEIQMNRPPVNAMNLEFINELASAHTRLCADDARAIVISGKEGLFSAGLDVPQLLGQNRDMIVAFWGSFFRLMNALAASPVPVVAAITGHSPAGGAVLTLYCDYRIAARGDFLIGLNEVRVGLPVPPNILFMLETIVGARQAMLLASSGAMLTPEQAHELGLVDELAEPGDVIPAAIRWAEKMLALPPAAMNTTRLAAKAGVIERAKNNEAYVETATDYWFSSETQVMMRKLVDDLGSKSN
jgi:enoyl-CoA hydratase/carnithine racemase